METKEAGGKEAKAMTEGVILRKEEIQTRETTDLSGTVRKIRRSEKSVKQYQYFVLRVLLLAAVIWVLFFKIVGLTHMPNADMYPRVDAGDLVLFYRLDKDVRSQDLVVIEKQTPDSGTEKDLFLLRVVAAPGDTVDVQNGHLIVNGNTVNESNIFTQTNVYDGYTQFPLTLGSDECFVLADDRDGGADSRYFGPVAKDEIQGTVISILRRNNL